MGGKNAMSVKTSVLIVDDNVKFVENQKFFFNKSGFVCDIAYKKNEMASCFIAV